MLVLPLRHPVVFAKQAASLDRRERGPAPARSRRRLARGGVRSRSTSRSRTATVGSWNGSRSPATVGRERRRRGPPIATRFPPGRSACRRPRARSRSWSGGHSPTALRRAGRLADGWLGQQSLAALDPMALANAGRAMRDAAVDAGRDPAELQVVLRIVDSAGRPDDLAAATPRARRGRGRRDHRRRRLGSRCRRTVRRDERHRIVTAEPLTGRDRPRHRRVPRNRRRAPPRTLGARGATVVAHYGSFREGADEAVAGIAPERRTLSPLDMSESGAARRLLARRSRARSRIDVVVVNAATMPRRRSTAPTRTGTTAGSRRSRSTSSSRRASSARRSRHFLEQGGGTVITLSSWAAQRGSAISSLAGLRRLEGRAREPHADHRAQPRSDGILAHVVAPGIVHTRDLRGFGGGARRDRRSQRGARDGRDGAARGGRRADRVPRHRARAAT